MVISDLARGCKDLCNELIRGNEEIKRSVRIVCYVGIVCCGSTLRFFLQLIPVLFW